MSMSEESYFPLGDGRCGGYYRYTVCEGADESLPPEKIIALCAANIVKELGEHSYCDIVHIPPMGSFYGFLGWKYCEEKHHPTVAGNHNLTADKYIKAKIWVIRRILERKAKISAGTA